MKLRFFIMLLLAGTLLGSQAWTWNSATAGEETMQMKKKRKKPKKKKKKAKKTHSAKSAKEQTEADKKKAEEAKKKKAAKRQKEKDKNLARIAKEQEKKNKKIEKHQKDREDYDECDSTKIVRTSADTLQLVKYMKVYHSLGGLCYIHHLQQMGKLLKTSDGFYTVKIRPSTDPRAPADWQTYLYCPIGKPDGMVALVSPEGDTVQICSYAGEKKHGLMTWYKKGEGMIHQERYVNDEKVWGLKPE